MRNVAGVILSSVQAVQAFGVKPGKTSVFIPHLDLQPIHHDSCEETVSACRFVLCLWLMGLMVTNMSSQTDRRGEKHTESAFSCILMLPSTCKGLRVLLL